MKIVPVKANKHLILLMYSTGIEVDGSFYILIFNCFVDILSDIGQHCELKLMKIDIIISYNAI